MKRPSSLIWSHLCTALGCLFLVAAQTGADQRAGARPKTLASLHQQMYSKQSQRKQLNNAKASTSAPLFLEAPQYSIGVSPDAVAVADFNGDGKDDLAIANFCADQVSCGNTDEPSSVSILLGNGDGTFKTPVDYTIAMGSVSLVIGDFNNDGKPDVAATNICSNPTCTASSVSILLGRGDGTLRNRIDYSTGPAAVGVAVADLDGDGNLDLVTADALDAVSVLLGNGDGSFKLNVDYP